MSEVRQRRGEIFKMSENLLMRGNLSGILVSRGALNALKVQRNRTQRRKIENICHPVLKLREIAENFHAH